MVVAVTSSTPSITGVTVSMSVSEATMLRRACYYNKTVGKKFANNVVAGGRRKGADLDAFLANLGNSLKAKDIKRF